MEITKENKGALEAVENAKKMCDTGKVSAVMFTAISISSIGCLTYELMHGDTTAVQKLMGANPPTLFLTGMGFGVSSVLTVVLDRTHHSLEVAKKYLRELSTLK